MCASFLGIAKMALKRRRFTRSKRSKTKKLWSTSSSSTEPIHNQWSNSIEIMTSQTYPCTIAGLRWDISINNRDTNPAEVMWCIIAAREGTDPTTKLTGNWSMASIKPEQNVIAWGSGIIEPNQKPTSLRIWEGSTKSMRKMQIGDKLLLIIGKTNGMGDHNGHFQYSCNGQYFQLS